MGGAGQRLWEALLLGVPPANLQSKAAVAPSVGVGDANEGDAGSRGADEAMLQHHTSVGGGGGGSRTSAATPAVVPGTFRTSPEVAQALDSSEEGGESEALEALLVEAFQVSSPRFHLTI